MRNACSSPKSTEELNQNCKIEQEVEESDLEGFFTQNDKSDYNKYPQYPIDEEIHDLFDK